MNSASTPPMSDSRPTPEYVVRQLQQLPSSPKVLPRLKKLLADANSSLFDIVGLIRLDQGIAARVLQMGNSAYFSHGSRCYTVEEAVNRVGYDQVYQLVLNAVSSQVLVRPLNVYGIEASALWNRSVCCALAAELIAGRLNLDRDIAYTLGLFHGVGLVAIDEWATLRQPELRLGAGTLPLESCRVERDALGFSNAEVGGALLRLWDFPPAVYEPLRWQYLPRSTIAHTQYATLLHVAKWARSAVCHPELIHPPVERALINLIKLSPANLESLVFETQQRLNDVNRLLEFGEASPGSPVMEEEPV